MKKINLLIVSIVGLSLVYSCGKDNKTGPTPDPDPYTFPDNTVDVYILGYQRTPNDSGKITYWKNGVAFNVTDGKHKAAGRNITVSDHDVYISGYELNSAGIYVAKYWKNGQEIILSDGSVNAFAYSIAVINNDVYVTGRLGNTAVYWKNGIPITLQDGQIALGIASNGTDIYIVGGNYINPNLPKCWKNGIEYPLNDTTNSYCTSIKVVGDDIYIAGNWVSENGYQMYPRYWRNGNGMFVDKSSFSSQVNSIDVDGDDVYICGSKALDLDSSSNFYSTAGYWKNNNYVLLGNKGIANEISKSGNFLYVVGSRSDGTTNSSVLWINDSEFIVIEDNANIRTSFLGMTVVKK